MTDSKTELLPCPFCGGEAYHYAPGPVEHHIACRNYETCGADIKRNTEAEAIAAWNTRATLGSGTCKLEETESYPSENGWVHVLECSNCGKECEHVNGDYEYCPHCLAKNELFLKAGEAMSESYEQVPEQVKRENGAKRESYAPPLDVLLRCLENDYGIRAKWDGLRRVWLTESVTAELDYIVDKSRWHQLFGTPERAAMTMAGKCCDCCECIITDECKAEECLLSINDDEAEAKLLGWLREKAVKR